jgi:hypothetical protein
MDNTAMHHRSQVINWDVNALFSAFRDFFGEGALPRCRGSDNKEYFVYDRNSNIY